ncbi:hypothetical protein ACTWP5_30875 [Streptomyces sp. 4N509B]|uniref:hypothetical protein n=1 Tax=Streptomyces sp. 4N509B TaxID=3457413 RepID=UPI003FD3F433
MRTVDSTARDLLTLIYDMIATRDGYAPRDVDLRKVRYHVDSPEDLHRALSEHLPGPEPEYRIGPWALRANTTARQALANPRSSEEGPWTGPAPESGRLWRLWESLHGYGEHFLEDTLPSSEHGPGIEGKTRIDNKSMFEKAAEELRRSADQVLLPAVGALSVGQRVRVHSGGHAGRSGRILHVTWHTHHQQVTDPATYLVDFNDMLHGRAHVIPDHLRPLPSWDPSFVTVFAGEEPPESWAAAVLLPAAGDEAWRQQVLSALKEKWPHSALVGRMVVFVPQPREAGRDISNHAVWGRSAAAWADVILCLAGDPAASGIDDGPALLGQFASHGSTPSWEHHRLLPVEGDPHEAAAAVMGRVGKGATRVDGERDVPLVIWRSAPFSAWRSRTGSNTAIVSARLEWLDTDPSSVPRRWALRLRLRHHGAHTEDVFSDEVVLGGPNTLSLIIIHHRQPWTDSTVLLLREAPASAIPPENVWQYGDGIGHLRRFDGPMLTLPYVEIHHQDGGIPIGPILTTIAEGTGVVLKLPESKRSRGHEMRQDSTSVTAVNRTARYDLSAPEADALLTATEDPACRYRMCRVADLLANGTVDWATLGKITRAAVPTSPPRSGDLST